MRRQRDTATPSRAVRHPKDRLESFSSRNSEWSIFCCLRRVPFRKEVPSNLHASLPSLGDFREFAPEHCLAAGGPGGRSRLCLGGLQLARSGKAWNSCQHPLIPAYNLEREPLHRLHSPAPRNLNCDLRPATWSIPARHMRGCCEVCFGFARREKSPTCHTTNART